MIVFGYSETAVLHTTKIFLLVQMAFWVQNTLMIMFQNFADSKDKRSMIVYSAINLIFTNILYTTNLYYISLIVYFTHLATQFLSKSAFFLTRTGKSEHLAYAASLLHSISCVLNAAIGGSWLILWGGSKTANDQGTTIIAALICAFIWITYDLFVLISEDNDMRHPGGFYTGKFGFPSMTRVQERNSGHRNSAKQH